MGKVRPTKKELDSFIVDKAKQVKNNKGVISSIGYAIGGEIIRIDHPKCLAKIDDYELRKVYYIRKSTRDNKFVNPWDLTANPLMSQPHTGVEPYEWEKVKSETFTKYLTFIQTRHQRHYDAAVNTHTFG